MLSNQSGLRSENTALNTSRTSTHAFKTSQLELFLQYIPSICKKIHNRPTIYTFRYYESSSMIKKVQ